MNSIYTTAVTISVCSLITNAYDETLIGINSEGETVIPAGVLLPQDKGNPLSALQRVEQTLLGNDFTACCAVENPLVICTSTRSGNVAADPVPGQKVNLIYVYRRVAIKETRVQLASNDMLIANFVPDSFFKKDISRRGKAAEVIGRARSKFGKAGLWPTLEGKGALPLHSLETQLYHCCFDPSFVNAQLDLLAPRMRQLAYVA